MADRYEILSEYISLEGLTYDRDTHQREEIEILNPRLEALGYSDIEWLTGESDSFGPLTRVCSAVDRDGKIVWFMYG